MTPEISIIVPVYNSEAYLRQCIESVMGQDFCDWELLLVDDGSTDGSTAICEEYASKDDRVKHIRQKNEGPSSARNNGIKSARGQYLFFLDSDDVIRKDALSHLYKVVKENDVEIASGRHVFTERYDFDSVADKYNLKIYTAEKMISNVLYQKRNFDSSVCWKLYKADLFKGLEFSRRFEDLDMFYKLYERAGRIALTDRIIYFYRKHPASFINSWTERRLDILDVVDNILTFVSARMPSLLRAAYHRQFSAYYNVYIGLKLNDPERRILSDRCFSVIKKLRCGVLLDLKSRPKNRIGAIASFFGEKNLIKLAKWASKY